MNGGIQPKDMKIGNNTLPVIDPIRPNIIERETIIVLRKETFHLHMR